MNKFFVLVVMAVASICFVSCEKDDKNVDTNPFVGSWLYEAADIEIKTKFNADKTFEISEYTPSSGQGVSYTGIYTYSETTLYLEYQKENGKEWNYKKERDYYFIDANTLILDKWTYKKQK